MQFRIMSPWLCVRRLVASAIDPPAYPPAFAIASPSPERARRWRRWEGKSSCRAGAEHLGTSPRSIPSVPPLRRSCGPDSSTSRSWSCGCTRKQQRLAASCSVRPFGPAPPSMRVDLLINHQVLHSFCNDSKPELGELTHLTHGTLTRCPALFPVAPSSPVCP
jgi:hypothetical protein